MAPLKLTTLQIQIMDIFWEHGGLSVREVHEAFPLPRPAYTTLLTLIGRLETRGALKRIRKIGNAYIFKATVSRDSVQRRALDDFLTLFGGRPKLLMARLAECGKLTLEDVQEAERYLRSVAKPDGEKK